MGDRIRLNSGRLEDQLTDVRDAVWTLNDLAHRLNAAINMLPSGSRFLRLQHAELKVQLRKLEQEAETLRQLYGKTLYTISCFEELERELAKGFQNVGSGPRIHAGFYRPVQSGLAALLNGRRAIAGLFGSLGRRYRRYTWSRNRNRYFLMKASWRKWHSRKYMGIRYAYGFRPARATRFSLQSYLRRKSPVYRRLRSFVPGWLRRLY